MRWDWKVLVGIVVAAVVAGWFLTRTVREPADVDAEAIDRDLTALAQALRTDLNDPIEIVPPIASGIHFPSSLPYHRAVDFWRPVLGETRHIRGGGRRGRR